MKLRRIAIGQLPGIDEPFAIEEIGDGIQIIIGPNGIGKSSVCRAVRALLWNRDGTTGFVAASALFEPAQFEPSDGAGEPWRVEREGTRHGWLQAGSPSPGPPLPAGHLDGCYFLRLRDLLDASDHAGVDLAQRIRRQMSGGYDLDEIARQRFAAIGRRTLQNAASKLDRTDQQVRRASAQHGELARKEQRLDELDHQLETAEAAAHRIDLLDHALDALGHEQQRARITAELAKLPPATEHLTGNELTDVEQREKEREAKRRQLGEARSQIDAAGKEARDTRLEEALDPAALATWRTRADDLATLEGQRDAAQTQWHERQAELTAASQALGGRAGELPTIDTVAAAELFAFLRQATRADDAAAATHERLAVLSVVSAGNRDGDDNPRRLALLERGLGSLRTWLRAPDPDDTAAKRSRSRRFVLLAIAAVLVTVAGGLGLAATFGWTDVAGVALVAVGFVGTGLGLTVGTLLLRPAAAAGSPRARAEQDFPNGLEPPTVWRSTPVAERLHTLEDEASQRTMLAQRIHDREVETVKLESQRRAAAVQQSAVAKERDDLARRLGLEQIAIDAELVDTARVLDTLRQARQAERGAAQGVQTLDERYQSRLADLAAALGQRGETEPIDAASARAAVDRLSARDGCFRAARQRKHDAKLALDQHQTELETISEKVSAIYQQAGLEADDRAGLVRLLEHIEPAKTLRKEQNACAVRIELDRERLAAKDALVLLERDKSQLDAEKAQLDTLSNGRNALHTEIADIRAEVKQAREGHGLEDAIADRDACQERLAQHQERELFAAAGRFWIDTVKQEHETTQMPRVLERARELFARFTHHAYALCVTADGSGSFVAIEASTGATRRLGELSDGTRGQLLLAARLAFAEQAEHGARLPLFLDEALDHSDPARFAAIVASLGRMAKEDDRQIFYLTNDPADVQRIERTLAHEGLAPPGVIDLAAIRGRTASVTHVEELFVEGLPEIPSPASKTAEEYATMLGVPPLDPRRGPAAQHLFHLTWDALPLLHRLLESGIRTAGQWRMLAEGGGRLATEIQAGPWVTRTGVTRIGKQLSDRVSLLEAFCQAWCEGRGKAVDRQAIEQSEAISDRYLDAVADLTAELYGDADRLLRALRGRGDARLRGFRIKAVEELEAFLIDASFLDPRPVLAEADMAARLASTPAAAKLPERTVAACSHRWWRLAERSGPARQRRMLTESRPATHTGDIDSPDD